MRDAMYRASVGAAAGQTAATAVLATAPGCPVVAQRTFLMVLSRWKDFLARTCSLQRTMVAGNGQAGGDSGGGGTPQAALRPPASPRQ